jgi:hypothetical protein
MGLQVAALIQCSGCRKTIQINLKPYASAEFILAGLEQIPYKLSNWDFGDQGFCLAADALCPKCQDLNDD